MLIHDIIKIRYVQEGYLPDYPYHLISDDEMFDAFFYNDTNYFDMNYPCPNKDFQQKYQNLKTWIHYHISKYRKNQDAPKLSKRYVLPDWVYSYMIGAVIGPMSPIEDRHDLFVLLHLDNTEDEFNEAIYTAIYRTSEVWTFKLTSEERKLRPPTMFGEPHVLKSLNLSAYQ